MQLAHLSASVPTLLLSYSKKAIGMSRYVYGSEKHVHPVSEFGSDAFLSMLSDMLANRNQLSTFLHQRNQQIRSDAELAAQRLAETLNG